MNIQGTYTNKGLALTAKTAAGACLRVSRVVGGSGHTTDVLNAAALPEIRQTLTVGEACCTGDTAVLPVTGSDRTGDLIHADGAGRLRGRSR